MMTEKQHKTSVLLDPLNRSNGRNRHNTPEDLFNCGGFALSVYSWVLPYEKGDGAQGWTDEKRMQLVDLLWDWYDAEEIEKLLVERYRISS